MQENMSLKNIYPNPDQPRKKFCEKALAELAQSITENGLLEPIVVVKRKAGYMIVAGQRRWRACNLARMKKAPVRIIRAGKKKVAELALLENLQREDLNLIEEALGYQSLNVMGMTQREVAQKMGFKQTWRIQERLNLLKLHPMYRSRLMDKHITPSQAQELSRLPHEKPHILFTKIMEGKAGTYNKLRALANALLVPPMQQASFGLEPSEDEKQVAGKYDRILERLVGFVKGSFSEKDLKVLPRVTGSNVEINIQHIEQLVTDLNKIKRAMIQAHSRLDMVAKKGEENEENENSNRDGRGTD